MIVCVWSFMFLIRTATNCANVSHYSKSYDFSNNQKCHSDYSYSLFMANVCQFVPLSEQETYSTHWMQCRFLQPRLSLTTDLHLRRTPAQRNKTFFVKEQFFLKGIGHPELIFRTTLSAYDHVTFSNPCSYYRVSEREREISTQ